MKKRGFVHFVGLDGSEGMLQIAKNTGLYEDVIQCMLGDEELPVQGGKVLHHCIVLKHMYVYPPNIKQRLFLHTPE